VTRRPWRGVDFADAAPAAMRGSSSTSSSTLQQQLEEQENILKDLFGSTGGLALAERAFSAVAPGGLVARLWRRGVAGVPEGRLIAPRVVADAMCVRTRFYNRYDRFLINCQMWGPFGRVV